MKTATSRMQQWEKNISGTAKTVFEKAMGSQTGVEPRLRRRLRLFSLFLLLLTFITLAGSISLKIIGGNSWIAMLITSGFLLITFHASRTRFYRLAVWLAVILPAIPPIVTIILGSPEISPATELMWLALPMLIASLMMSIRNTLFVAVFYIILIIILAFFGSLDFNTVGPLMSFMIAIAFVVVTITYVRQKHLSEIEEQLIELQQAEKALRVSEEKFTKAFMLSPQEICITSLKDGRTVEINETFTRYSGFAREDIIGRTSTELHIWTKPGDREKVTKILKEKGQVQNEEFEFRDKDGSIRTHLFSAGLINFNGEDCLIAIMTDITENKKAEVALRKSEERFRQIFQQGPLGIMASGLDFHFMIMNDQFCKMLGYTEQELRSMTFKDFSFPEDVQEDQKNLQKLVKGELTHYKREKRYIKKNKEIMWGNLTVTLMRDESGKPLNILAMIEDITQRKIAEETLVNEATRRRVFIEQSRDGITILDQDGKVYEANQSFANMLGYTMEEARQLHIFDWDVTVPREQMLKNIRNTDENGANVERQHRRKDGTSIDVDISINTATFNGQKYLLTVSRDITERKRIENALKESEEKFSKAFRSSPVCVAITTVKDAKYVEINDSYMQITGYSREELIGKNPTSLNIWVNEQDRARMLRTLKEQGRISKEEFDFRMKSGAIRTWLFSGEPITFGGEECLMGVSIDITERKQMEKALSESEEKFSKAFHAIPEAISINRMKDQIFINVNESFCRANGHTIDEVIGHTAKELGLWVKPEEQDQITQTFNEQGHYENKEIEFQTKTGEIHTVLLSADIIDIGGERCVLTIGNDITKRKQAEEKLKLAMTGLEHSATQLQATNKELESFSYSVSHDLRSPLRSIDGFSQALLEDYADKIDGKGQDYLNRLRNASQKMGELIDGVLKISRLSRSEMHQEKVDLGAIAEEIIDRLKETHTKRRVKFIVGKDLITSGDPQMMRVLLENLLGNAWKFTAKTQHAQIELGKTSNGAQKTFFIKDNGAGFDMAFKDKLFGAFQRLHDTAEFPGTGIGLATVQRIINRHGGTIWAEGEVNKGATFYFSLS
jgi:PAS domain S-box-containing protein